MQNERTMNAETKFHVFYVLLFTLKANCKPVDYHVTTLFMLRQCTDLPVILGKFLHLISP